MPSRQRWRSEDAYKTVKRLLGLAYFWVGSVNGITLQLWATWLVYAVLVDLADDVADTLAVPFNAIALEMVDRSLYFCTIAFQRGEAAAPVTYLADHAKLFGLVKRKRKPDSLRLLTLTVLAQPELVTNGFIDTPERSAPAILPRGEPSSSASPAVGAGHCPPR